MLALTFGLALATGVAFLVWRSRQPLLPESLWVVRVTDTEVTCQPPDGVALSIALSDLTSIRIRTTGDGPWEPDVFWGFHGPTGETALVVPGGATGEQEMIGALSKLPGWDDSAVIEAMGSTSNRSFVVWERAQAE